MSRKNASLSEASPQAAERCWPYPRTNNASRSTQFRGPAEQPKVVRLSTRCSVKDSSMTAAQRPKGRVAAARLITPWVVSLGVLLSLPVFALDSDRQQPMRIRSDRSEADLAKDSTVLIGNVRITQGSLEVGAERAYITQAQGEVSRAVLTGKPATLRQQVEAGGELRAQARRIDYALANESIELTGGVVIERPQGTLRSERVVYSVKDGRVVAGDDAGGVELVIPPRAPAKPE